MENIVNVYKELQKYFDEKIKIPFVYVLFSINILIIYNVIKVPDYSNFISTNILNAFRITGDFILDYGDALYDKIICLWIGGTVVYYLIEFIDSRVNIPKREDIKYTDGTTSEVSYYVGGLRIWKFLLWMSTGIWIYYITLKTIMGESVDLTSSIGNQFLFFINLFFLSNYVYNILFDVRKKELKLIKISQLGGYRYTILNFKAIENIKKEYFLMKDNISDEVRYYIVSKDSDSNGFRNVGSEYNKEDKAKYVKIHNESTSLEEVMYHFNNIESINKHML